MGVSKNSTFFYKGGGGGLRIFYVEFIIEKLLCISWNISLKKRKHNQNFRLDSLPSFKIIIFKTGFFGIMISKMLCVYLFFLGGGGLRNFYVVFMGGLANFYFFLQGGRGCQKRPNFVLRRKRMAPQASYLSRISTSEWFTSSKTEDLHGLMWHGLHGNRIGQKANMTDFFLRDLNINVRKVKDANCKSCLAHGFREDRSRFGGQIAFGNLTFLKLPSVESLVSNPSTLR